MNLTTLKASAELAKTSKAELEIWQMEISPDDVLRLVEVARAAVVVIRRWHDVRSWSAVVSAIEILEKSLEGLEP
jgi:hypothetical protein